MWNQKICARAQLRTELRAHLGKSAGANPATICTVLQKEDMEQKKTNKSCKSAPAH